MKTAELKLTIFRQIDTLEKNKLDELYGLLINYINGQKDISEWEQLPAHQKQGIYDAIEEIDAGKGIMHEKVMTKYRKKYAND